MPKISKSQLLKLQKKYPTDEAIGKLYGISRQAVHQLRIKYGVDKIINKKAERNSYILQLHRQGFSGPRISRKVKVSVSQVYRIIHAARNFPSTKQ